MIKSENQPRLVASNTMPQAPEPNQRGFGKLHLLPLVIDSSLEPMSCIVHLNLISLDVLVTNIEECITRLSLQATYMSQPASAGLLSEEYVLMHLSIWKTGSDQATVVIQNRMGDDAIFEGYARQLLKAALGEMPVLQHEVKDIKRLMTSDNCRAAKIARLVPLTETYQWTAIDVLHMAHSMLTKNEPRWPQPGLELLVTLSNPRKADTAISILVSRMVMLGTITPGTMDKEASEMQCILLDILLQQKVQVSDADHGKMDIVGLFPSEYVSTNANLLLKLGLTVLENSLEVAIALEPYESDLVEVMPACLVDNFLTRTRMSHSVCLVSVLLAYMGQAETMPHIARVATSCIRLMCMVSENVVKEVLKVGGMDVVEKAYMVGKSSHAKLELECIQLLSLFQISK